MDYPFKPKDVCLKLGFKNALKELMFFFYMPFGELLPFLSHKTTLFSPGQSPGRRPVECFVAQFSLHNFSRLTLYYHSPCDSQQISCHLDPSRCSKTKIGRFVQKRLGNLTVRLKFSNFQNLAPLGGPKVQKLILRTCSPVRNGPRALG